jgi:hypothetical protein
MAQAPPLFVYWNGYPGSIRVFEGLLYSYQGKHCINVITISIDGRYLI